MELVLPQNFISVGGQLAGKDKPKVIEYLM
jgi:hypothetical protein